MSGAISPGEECRARVEPMIEHEEATARIAEARAAELSKALEEETNKAERYQGWWLDELGKAHKAEEQRKQERVKHDAEIERLVKDVRLQKARTEALERAETRIVELEAQQKAAVSKSQSREEMSVDEGEIEWFAKDTNQASEKVKAGNSSLAEDIESPEEGSKEALARTEKKTTEFEVAQTQAAVNESPIKRDLGTRREGIIDACGEKGEMWQGGTRDAQASAKHWRGRTDVGEEKGGWRAELDLAWRDGWRRGWEEGWRKAWAMDEPGPETRKPRWEAC